MTFMHKTLKTISNAIKNVDSLGEELKINFHQRALNSTVCGGICSCFLYIILAMVSARMLQQSIITTDPDVAQKITVLSNGPTMDLYGNKIYYVISAKIKETFSNETYLIPPTADELKRYFTIIARTEKVQFKTDSDTETKYLATTVIPFDFQPCGNLHYPDALLINELHKKNTQNPNNNNETLCINLDDEKDQRDYDIFGATNQYPNKNFQLIILPCIGNATVTCVDDDKVDSMQLIINRLQVSIDPTLYNNPKAYYLEASETFNLDVKQTLEMRETLKTVTIMDERYDFIGQLPRDSYLEQHKQLLHGYPRNVGPGNTCDKSDLGDELTVAIISKCLPYAIFYLESGPTQEEIARKYKTLIQTLSDIGGFFDITIMIVGFFFCYCRNSSYNYYMKKNVLIHPTEDYIKMVPGLERKRMEDMLQSVIEDKSDAAELFNRMGSVRVMERLLFKSYHKALLPLVLALLKFSEGVDFDDDAEEDKTGLDMVHKKRSDKHDEYKKMSFEDAFEMLNKSQPKTEIEKEVKEFMLKVINRSKKRTTRFKDLVNLMKNNQGNKDMFRQATKKAKLGSAIKLEANKDDEENAYRNNLMTPNPENQRLRIRNKELGVDVMHNQGDQGQDPKASKYL